MIIALCLLMLFGVIGMSAAAIAWSHQPEQPKSNPLDTVLSVAPTTAESTQMWVEKSCTSRRESNLGDINDMSAVKIDDFLDNDD